MEEHQPGHMNVSRQHASAAGCSKLPYSSGTTSYPGTSQTSPTYEHAGWCPSKRRGPLTWSAPHCSERGVATSCSRVCNGGVSHQRSISAPPPVRHRGGRSCTMCGMCSQTRTYQRIPSMLQCKVTSKMRSIRYVGRPCYGQSASEHLG